MSPRPNVIDEDGIVHLAGWAWNGSYRGYTRCNRSFKTDDKVPTVRDLMRITDLPETCLGCIGHNPSGHWP